VGKRDNVPGLGSQLKAAREKAALAQAAAAEAAAVPQASISQFETGTKTPTLSTLYKLAEAYGVNVCELLPGGVLPDTAADEPAKPKKGKK
jgi:transcriptional regulator with XRE-family HTH domain